MLYNLGLGNDIVEEIRGKLKLPLVNAIRRFYGIKSLALTYAFNLRMMLEYITLLIILSS